MAFGDLERELAATRRVLERLPEEHYSWKPHEKSMSLGRLALHVANLLYWQLVTGESSPGTAGPEGDVENAAPRGRMRREDGLAALPTVPPWGRRAW